MKTSTLFLSLFLFFSASIFATQTKSASYAEASVDPDFQRDPFDKPRRYELWCLSELRSFLEVLEVDCLSLRSLSDAPSREHYRMYLAGVVEKKMKEVITDWKGHQLFKRLSRGFITFSSKKYYLSFWKRRFPHIVQPKYVFNAQSLNLKELPYRVWGAKDLELEINGTLGAGFPIVEKYIREDGVLVDQSKYSMYWGSILHQMMVEIITFWKESRNEKRAKSPSPEELLGSQVASLLE